jgi:hypothetical protein
VHLLQQPLLDISAGPQVQLLSSTSSHSSHRALHRPACSPLLRRSLLPLLLLSAPLPLLFGALVLPLIVTAAGLAACGQQWW